jgi:uncharacterized protein (TIGR02284 family)
MEAPMTSREDALSNLYTRLVDSRDGYGQAAERVDSPYIKGVIAEMIDRRTTNAAQIRQFLAGLGQNPSDDGSTLASAHRAFLSLKDSITGSGDEAIMQEIVRGEETLLDAYDKAIEAAGPTDPELAFLREQHAGLKTKVEEFRARAQAAA